MMKKIKYLVFALVIGLSFMMPQAHAMKIKILGKGGIVIYPDGTQKICPNFSFRVCYEVEVTIDDIIDILFNYYNGSVNNTTANVDINNYLPMNAVLQIYEETAVVTRQAQIIWLDNAYFQAIEAGEITLPSTAINVKLL